MRTTTLALTASLAGVAMAAAASPADACNCRVRHHHTYSARAVYYRPASYVGHVRYYRPYAYRYRTPVYDDDWGYDPYVYRSYYDWTYVPPPRVWVDYEGPYYGGGYWWRHHGRGHWHGDHWDHGWHRGWR